MLDSASAAAAASKTTYAGGTAAVLGWFISSGPVATVGMIVAILGFIVNFYFRWKDDKRLQAFHDAKMRQMAAPAGDE